MGLVIAPLVALPVFADSANVQSSQLWEYTNPTYGIVLAKIGANIALNTPTIIRHNDTPSDGIFITLISAAYDTNTFSYTYYTEYSTCVVTGQVKPKELKFIYNSISSINAEYLVVWFDEYYTYRYTDTDDDVQWEEIAIEIAGLTLEALSTRYPSLLPIATYFDEVSFDNKIITAIPPTDVSVNLGEPIDLVFYTYWLYPSKQGVAYSRLYITNIDEWYLNHDPGTIAYLDVNVFIKWEFSEDTVCYPIPGGPVPVGSNNFNDATQKLIPIIQISSGTYTSTGEYEMPIYTLNGEDDRLILLIREA